MGSIFLNPFYENQYTLGEDNSETEDKYGHRHEAFTLNHLGTGNLFAHTHIVSVDMPGHVAVGNELAVDVAADLTVPPAVVDVDNADHVPLQYEKYTKIKHNRSFRLTGILHTTIHTYLTQLQPESKWRKRSKEPMK